MKKISLRKLLIAGGSVALVAAGAVSGLVIGLNKSENLTTLSANQTSSENSGIIDSFNGSVANDENVNSNESNAVEKPTLGENVSNSESNDVDLQEVENQTPSVEETQKPDVVEGEVEVTPTPAPSKPSIDDSKPAGDYKIPEPITQGVKDGDLYVNQREYMPILNGTSYRDNERTVWNKWDRITPYDWFKSNTNYSLNDYYPGWDVDNNWTYFGRFTNASTGERLPVTLVRFVASQELKNTYPNLQTTSVQALKIECFGLSGQQVNDYINKYTKQFSEITMLTLSGLSQEALEQVVVPTQIKKLTILDMGEWNSQIQSLRGITIPESVQELEFYSRSCRRINPLILSPNTHMIWDTDTGNYKPFDVIDLSGISNLTEKDVQRAIDIVYGERKYERHFQGDFTGGYIYKLDVSKTNITSLNNIYVPSQEDGRFNITYVKFTMGGLGEIVIGDNNKYPSNDSNVQDWYDPEFDYNKAVDLTFTSKGLGVSLSKAASQIVGHMNKYSNINKVTLTDVVLLDQATKEQLIESVKAGLASHFPAEKISAINFVK